MIVDSIMQKSFNINSASGNYSLAIAENLLHKILANTTKGTVVIIDRNILEYIKNYNIPHIIIDVAESAKDLVQIPHIIKELKTLHANRSTNIIAIGGGVIQDISCFVCSIYMRGLEWSYFPTTTLGMMDSCIGGKSSINVCGIKNLVGNFYPPQNLYIDPIFLGSLTNETILSGIFEAIKICYAKSYCNNNTFNNIYNLTKSYLKDGQHHHLVDIIYSSLMEKKWFIENDEFDKKERQLLNFGHTFGHAIESATSYAIQHGIAVGIGMLCAIQVSKTLGNEAGSNVNELQEIIASLLHTQYASIDTFRQMNIDAFMQAFKQDKKHFNNEYKLILPVHDSNFALQNIALKKSDGSDHIIKESILNTITFLENL